MMFCCNTGEAGCCTSSSSSDVDVEDPFAAGSKIVGVGICAGLGWRRLKIQAELQTADPQQDAYDKESEAVKETVVRTFSSR
jgi:hypothetical protein